MSYKPLSRLHQKQSIGKLYFHSITIPQSIQDEIKLIQNFDVVDGQTSSGSSEQLHKKLKTSKLVMHVVYYQQNKSKGKYVQKRRRFVIGKNSVKDLSDGIDIVNPMIVKSMRTRVKELVITGKDFNVDKVASFGGFLSKQFWQANLLWGNEDSLEKNLLATTKAIHKILPFVESAAPTKKQLLEKKPTVKDSDGSTTQNLVPLTTENLDSLG